MKQFITTLSAVIAMMVSASCAPSINQTTRSLPSSVSASNTLQVASSQAQRSFGFAYMGPSECGHSWLNNYEKVPLCRNAFERDRMIMSSLGVRSVKLVLVPSFNGINYIYNSGTHICSAVNLSSDLDAIGKNLTTVVKKLGSLGIKSVIAFMTNEIYLRSSYGFHVHRNNQSFFSQCYMNRRGGSERDNAEVAAGHLVAWEKSITHAVQSDAAANSFVDFFILMTEGHYGDIPGWGKTAQHLLTQRLLSEVRLKPGSKIGMDVGHNPQTAHLLQNDSLAVGVPIDITALHPYPKPGSRSELVASLTSDIESLRASMPFSNVIIGEAGVDYCDTVDERQQVVMMDDIISAAERLNVTPVYNWTLFDQVKGDCANGGSGRWGVGFEANRPRDYYGYLVDRSPLSVRGDFEGSLGGWFAGGEDADWSLDHIQGDPADAATGRSYLRLRVHGKKTYWMCSPTVEVNQANKLVIGGFARSSGGVLGIDVHWWEGSEWKVSSHKREWNEAWKWKNIQNLSDDLRQSSLNVQIDLPEKTDKYFFCFTIKPHEQASDSYFDIDGISTNAF